ncbi:hypothetical protein [Methanoplanus endosymbiosus]|uniref:Uncharacterized protein n=1 Tax=Methanoplanus endosymbiosus TaxID=33865 RepID=A0A9E7PNP5_9EURY|nr:hypothetical protein [Methanoplanus endosymbiosus]UUX92276.1 hypothetical protein L6E24_13155 [Methanoplanus endosymbiosus]
MAVISSPDKLNSERKSNSPAKCAWIEVMLEPEFNIYDKRDLNKEQLFDELSQDCWNIFESMVEWQTNAIRYSLPTD